jgi:hypothetical protein
MSKNDINCVCVGVTSNSEILDLYNNFRFLIFTIILDF